MLLPAARAGAEPSGGAVEAVGKATGNRPYEGAAEAQESITAMLREKEIPVVKMYNCLAR